MASAETPQRRPFVLVVDDRAQSRVQIRRALAHREIGAVEACDGREAWQVFGSTRPDAVVTDLRMPRCDGLELLERIASDSSTPVFCLTSQPDWESSVAAIKRGARDYYQWPRDLERMISEIESCVRRRGSLDEARQRGRRRLDSKREAELRALVESESGNVTQIADKLGVDRKTVYAWLRRYGIRLRPDGA